MRHLRLLVLLILLFSLANCEKKEDFLNRKTDARVVGFIMEKCYCCWGWVIKIGSETIKSEHIPTLVPSENIVFPIDARIVIGSKTIDCTEGKLDYYEIKEFTPVK